MRVAVSLRSTTNKASGRAHGFQVSEMLLEKKGSGFIVPTIVDKMGNLLLTGFSVVSLYDLWYYGWINSNKRLKVLNFKTNCS